MGKASPSTPKLPQDERFKSLRPNQRAYLVALAETGVVLKASQAAKVDKSLPFYWRKMPNNEAFLSLEAEALAIGAESLVKEAYRRAVDGLVRKKFTKDGKPIIDPATGQHYAEYEYSDHLLSRLLEAKLPDFRRQYDVKHSGTIEIDLTARLAEAKERAIAKRLELAS